jgi:hypothetical protein
MIERGECQGHKAGVSEEKRNDVVRNIRFPHFLKRGDVVATAHQNEEHLLNMSDTSADLQPSYCCLQWTMLSACREQCDACYKAKQEDEPM